MAEKRDGRNRPAAIADRYVCGPGEYLRSRQKYNSAYKSRAF